MRSLNIFDFIFRALIRRQSCFFGNGTFDIAFDGLFIANSLDKFNVHRNHAADWLLCDALIVTF